MSAIIDEVEETRRGELLARVLQLKANEDGRYMLGEGYNTKTALGLYRTLRRIIEDGDGL